MVLPEPETLINLSMLSVLQNESKWENSVYDQSCQNVCVCVCVYVCVPVCVPAPVEEESEGSWKMNV